MATTRILYKGKKELTMAQFEALTNLDDAVDYDIVDFPNGSITNAQMTAALGYSRLFEDGEIYVCSDNGTYTKGNWYQIKVEGGVKSWEDITKGLKIYSVTDILNHDGIKSGTFTEEQINNIKLADILQVYAIDGDPVSKYAYKGLIPTNPAQSTISANLYFAVATEKGNYVLAINTETRNWEVREPVSGDLQNYVPKQSEAEPVALTWRFNDVVDTNRDNDFLVNFTSNGINFTEMGFKWSMQQSPAPKDTMYYSGPTKFQDVYYGQWSGDTAIYRTVTFETAPSGELLTWLQSNAVPQSETTNGSKTYAQITNENGAVSIRVFENSDADLQNLSITKDGVTINGKKPLTSVQPLYKHELVIPYSFSVTDQNTALTWTINDTNATAPTAEIRESINFSVQTDPENIGTNFDTILISNDSGIQYNSITTGMNHVAYFEGSSLIWNTKGADTSAYRTITFETAPTGELLTWLQANAVPQSESSNQSSADPTSETTTVNGSVTYHYLSNTGTQITSASEIGDNFLLSGGIGKNSESAALTWTINDTNATAPSSRIEVLINFSVEADPIGNIGTNFDRIVISEGGINYRSITTGDNHVAAFEGSSLIWNTKGEDKSAFRTITFETAPTGELLTWLQANAVPQGGVDSNTVLLFNVNVTKEGSSITVEAVNASTMGYITGTVGTITDTVTQLI